ncbi:MAG: hypothetical protein SVR81_07890 [Chloroflexota bacterium]|nr:hypothetical protein [Chloroflexota bacterium]
MVLVWGMLAKGNQEQNVVNPSINTVTIMFLYVPVVSFLTGMQGIPLDRDLLHFSALVYIRLPLILGTLNKKVLIWKGDNWFNQQYRPIIGKIATVALLSTLVILFSLNG